MLPTFDSEENIDIHVEEYLKVGVNITSHKTKLAKRVYILITITNFFILFFDLLEDTTSIKQDINDFLLKYIILVILVGVILLLLVIFLPERHNYTIFLVCMIWLCWIIYFSCIFSYLFKYWPNSSATYCIFCIHHLIITIYVVFKEVFDLKILVASIILSGFGIIFIIIQKFWKFPSNSYFFIFSLQYLLVNIFYFLLIQYFAVYHQKKFWRRRKCLTFFLIFILSNLTVLFVLLICIYFIYFLIRNKCGKHQNDNIDPDDTDIDIQVFLSKRNK